MSGAVEDQVEHEEVSEAQGIRHVEHKEQDINRQTLQSKPCPTRHETGYDQACTKHSCSLSRNFTGGDWAIFLTRVLTVALSISDRVERIKTTVKQYSQRQVDEEDAPQQRPLPVARDDKNSKQDSDEAAVIMKAEQGNVISQWGKVARYNLSGCVLIHAVVAPN